MGSMGAHQMGAQLGGVFGGMDGMGSADGYGVAGLQKPHPEFTMQNEDFPALPGSAPGKGGSGPLKDGGPGGAFGGAANFPPSSSLRAGPFHAVSGGSLKGPGDGGAGFHGGSAPFHNVPSAAQPNYQPPRGLGGANPGGSYDFGGGGGGRAEDARGARGAPAALGGVPGPDRSAASQSPSDRFGLLGLLGVIRMSDPDLTTLALGTDLTTLGLNLNSPEPLYKSFGSPWADTPPRPELELALPACYAVRTRRCHSGVFQKFQQETLFYVFYSCPGEEAQLHAADELIARGWGFHKELKAWLMRVAGTEPVTKSERGERGSFWIFDARVWDRVRKDNFNLQYDQLEARPRVPKPKQTQQGKDGKETFQGQQAANARARSENGEQSALAGNGGSGASL